MKFSSEKQATIRRYILEKIDRREPHLSDAVAGAFSVSPNTVHTYLRELIDEGKILHTGRDQYVLTDRKSTISLSRRAGELRDESRIYRQVLAPYLTALSPGVQRIWEYAFSEIVNNVIDHSEAETMTITVCQDSLNTAVTVYDNGIGIFRKIQAYFGFPTMEDGICELFKGKLTTDSQNHSGEGIFFSSRTMDSFCILSDGRVFTTDKFRRDEMWEIPQDGFSGTLVCMKLSDTCCRRLEEVFNTYTDQVGGFTKTVLPIRHFFESAPISRSQAKQLSARLEQFAEVELDFTGVDFMGQSFAHQLFVVFQREHPAVRLCPVNMEQEVQKIYFHVCPGKEY